MYSFNTLWLGKMWVNMYPVRLWKELSYLLIILGLILSILWYRFFLWLLHVRSFPLQSFGPIPCAQLSFKNREGLIHRFYFIETILQTVGMLLVCWMQKLKATTLFTNTCLWKFYILKKDWLKIELIKAQILLCEIVPTETVNFIVKHVAPLCK